MKNIRDNDLSERRKAAAEAKATLLRNYRVAKEAAEPTRIARQEERMAAAKVREELRAARERAKLEEQQRVQAENAERQAAADAVAAAEAAAREAAGNIRISRVVEDEAARKAERDRRYANRKARQR